MSLPYQSRKSPEDHWIPLSDLMTGLMMIFMLVAIVFMLQLKEKEKTARDLAKNYTDLRAQLCGDLRSTFKSDLNKWSADFSCNLTVRFLNPDIQFDTNQSIVKPGFRAILDEFFPRYINVLMSDKYRNMIEEVRIEGHTSRVWGSLPAEQAYYKNMALSQDRSRAVLEYVFSIPQIRNAKTLDWLVPLVTANGLSSNKPILKNDGTEDERRSQRVEFKVRTKAEDRLQEILGSLAK